MKKNYVKPSVKVREIDMESLLSASGEGYQLNSKFSTMGLENSPTAVDYNDGTHPVGASQNLWSEEEE